MKFLFYLQYGPKIFTAVLSIARAIEQEIPDEGFGDQKRGLVVDGVLKTFIEAAEDINEDFEKIKPSIENMVDAAVSFYKAVGIFK